VPTYQHKRDIPAQSVPTGPTTTIPTAIVSSDEDDETRNAGSHLLSRRPCGADSRRSGRTSTSTDRIHILVVDDLSDMADSMAEVLSLWGYKATPCYTGATALACARVRPPDAVLLDLAMPRMDGFQFAREFHGLKGCDAVPLVALSGYASPAYAARAAEAGIGHCLLKAADSDQLKAVLALVTNVRAVPSEPEGGLRRGLRSRRRTGSAVVALTRPLQPSPVFVG